MHPGGNASYDTDPRADVDVKRDTGMEQTQDHEAFGRPGIEPRWTHGGKDAVGTAYADASRIWFTLWNGIITEVYYPTVDRPQLRDLQYLITDGKSFFHEEKRSLASKLERLDDHALGYRCTNSDPEGRYAIVKEIITDPQRACLLQRTVIRGDPAFTSTLRLYALCAPHLQGCGGGNTGFVAAFEGQKVLMAHKQGVWLALAATVPFSRVSCGYVGRSDGWTDLAGDFQMDWEFDCAPDGNIALTGELPLHESRDFTLGLAFGDSQHAAVAALFQALASPFQAHATRYAEEWRTAAALIAQPRKVAADAVSLYNISVSVLRAHEDKSYRGAFVASLAIPWGEAHGDHDQGGYHLVWTRDLVNSASAMLASGDRLTPLRALVYLTASQREDGGFAQNFWVNGEPYYQGIQLDEVAFPVMLACHLKRQNALEDFDPYPMVLKAAAYLVRHGPVTQQERWEEVGGYSPSTLASNIAALVGAAALARDKGDGATASFLEQYADFLESHVEAWTVTTSGTLVAGIPRHYIRILPARVDDPHPNEDPNRGTIVIANRPPGAQRDFPANSVVDAGFLQLVRYGIRRADDPAILDSLRVVDAELKVDTPFGPCWRRYNHDGYGQREDGGPFTSGGQGRAWPLLTGERAHYELAAGHDVTPFLRAMMGFASSTGLLPEQVWDQAERPDIHMYLGRPTGSAMPLAWAHAEYVKLLRSVSDGTVFDLIPEVADRYLGGSQGREAFEVWKPNRQVTQIKKGVKLRIQMLAPFRLHWSCDEWQSVQDSSSTPTALGIEFADIVVPKTQAAPVRFTFFWTDSNHWEGHDYAVRVV